MLKIFVMLLILFLGTAFIQIDDDSSATSPSPDGDTRMGADAATSGTDITDKELQALEDKIYKPDDDSEIKKADPTEEDRSDIDVK